MEGTWKTKDGKIINIKDMTDLHLKNSICMLERKIDEIEEEHLSALSFAASCQGEMASYYAWNGVYDSIPSPIPEQKLEELRKEMLRRKLNL